MKCVSILIALVALFSTSATFVAAEKGEKVATRFTTWKVKMGGNTNTFTPNNLPDVKVGDSVEFTNAGGTHTATSDDYKTSSPKTTFNTGTMKKGQVTVIFFNSAGTFKYHCEFHGPMTGTIVVTE
jgi:plastocyanin